MADALRPLALVTGGWRRIGAAIARTLALAGYDLVLHAHSESKFAPEFAVELNGFGAAVHPLAADLADAQAVTRLPAEAMALAGRAPTLLVNCAALFREDSAATVTAAMLDEHLAVNLTAPVLLTRALAELADGDAAVIHILDQRVLNPVPDQLSYTLSKQALHAAVRTLARSLSPRVRVNAVAPGLTLPTPDYTEEQWLRLTALMPLERLASPADVAEAVLFLAQARAITGQTIFVDGGAHLESFARDFVYLET
ncbi:short-chain dehydrogenase [Novosphingobium fuchskuhlense]|uniref:Short-chain dehydrogenase n=1 Tax=Novosphingobium fuchskuhlense TaxID=1117702 RepID=A0A117UY03_9SPHN|nr:SDR family oxidoreductase [Novosphingobium fuchskuhlense]KUR72912.1 short-chain dehydrogenase [Novosphingobium fuchskuhlense]